MLIGQSALARLQPSSRAADEAWIDTDEPSPMTQPDTRPSSHLKHVAWTLLPAKYIERKHLLYYTVKR